MKKEQQQQQQQPYPFWPKPNAIVYATLMPRHRTVIAHFITFLFCFVSLHFLVEDFRHSTNTKIAIANAIPFDLIANTSEHFWAENPIYRLV